MLNNIKFISKSSNIELWMYSISDPLSLVKISMMSNSARNSSFVLTLTVLYDCYQTHFFRYFQQWNIIFEKKESLQTNLSLATEISSFEFKTPFWPFLPGCFIHFFVFFKACSAVFNNYLRVSCFGNLSLFCFSIY